MNLDNINSIYFIGIGGIGMSALARYFKSKGCEVAGYDKTSTSLTDQLIAEGMKIHFEDDIKQLPEQLDLVIYTPAIPGDHQELNHLMKGTVPIMKRSEVLGLISKEKFTIAVAGTHGKTSVSSLIAHILESSGVGCTAFLGGIAVNYQSNFFSSNRDIIVVEADEYDRSFLRLFPNIAVITALDPDHMDIYGNPDALREAYEQFAQQVYQGGVVLYKKGLGLQLHGHVTSSTYSASEVADYYADAVSIQNTKQYNAHSDKEIVTPSYIFNWVGNRETIEALTLSVPGRHFVENAVVAVAVAKNLKIDNEKIRAALRSFKGIKRRFEYQINSGLNAGVNFIDDYAHHPHELSVTIDTAKLMYPDKRLTVVFQPHLFSRTKDFAVEFAETLDRADEVILLDIYPAREKPIPGVTSQLIYDHMKKEDKTICSKDELLDEIRSRNIQVLMTLGAGDIDKLVLPIKKILLEK